MIVIDVWLSWYFASIEYIGDNIIQQWICYKAHSIEFFFFWQNNKKLLNGITLIKVTWNVQYKAFFLFINSIFELWHECQLGPYTIDYWSN